MTLKNKTEDPIDRIRRVRHEISARLDHDPRKLVDYYIELQKEHSDRLIESPAPTGDGARRSA
jgi:hypothetical protein